MISKKGVIHELRDSGKTDFWDDELGVIVEGMLSNVMCNVKKCRYQKDGQCINETLLQISENGVCAEFEKMEF